MPPKKKIKWIPLPRSEKAEELNNPYCGLYSIFRLYAESIVCKDEGVSLEELAIDSSQRICLVEINLIHFNDKPLSDDALRNIERIFKYFTAHGKQMILRFVYDWDGKGIVSEPKDIEDILGHMAQLAPLLKGYERHIYIIQGLFIGSWGEMHNSRYLNERNISRLARQLYDCSGDSTQIALRCPSYWRMIFKTYDPLNDETAFSKFMGARFSLFNDGMLGSETDFGTYGNCHAKEAVSYSERWIRQDELEFQNKLCRYVSNGGEVINHNEYNDTAPSIEALRTMRVSYLHAEYDEQVLNKWKASKSGLPDSLWKDKSAFEYIAAHLGYRFEIKDVKLNISSKKGNNIKINSKICNTGFAPCYHRFDVKFAIRRRAYTELFEYDADTDTRFWMPGDTIEIEAEIPADRLQDNKYIVCAGIFDPRSDRHIELANTFSSADYKGYYSIGNIVVY